MHPVIKDFIKYLDQENGTDYYDDALHQRTYSLEKLNAPHYIIALSTSSAPESINVLKEFIQTQKERIAEEKSYDIDTDMQYMEKRVEYAATCMEKIVEYAATCMEKIVSPELAQKAMPDTPFEGFVKELDKLNGTHYAPDIINSNSAALERQNAPLDMYRLMNGMSSKENAMSTLKDFIQTMKEKIKSYLDEGAAPEDTVHLKNQINLAQNASDKYGIKNEDDVKDNIRNTMKNLRDKAFPPSEKNNYNIKS